MPVRALCGTVPGGFQRPNTAKANLSLFVGWGNRNGGSGERTKDDPNHHRDRPGIDHPTTTCDPGMVPGVRRGNRLHASRADGTSSEPRFGKAQHSASRCPRRGWGAAGVSGFMAQAFVSRRVQAAT